MGDFIADKINEKWSEEMPVMYELFMLLQDELFEAYKEENGGLLPGQKDASSELKITFETPQLAEMHIELS